MCNLDPLRVDSLKDSVDNPVFASCIYCLENDKDLHLMLGVEHFRKLSQLLVEFLRLPTLVLTLALKAGGVAGIEPVQVSLFSWIYSVPAKVEVACHC